MKILLILLTAAAVSFNAAAQDNGDDMTLIVDMQYADGKWRAKPRTVLPCAGPSKQNATGSATSLISVVNEKGKSVYERTLINPRIILVEDPKEPVGLLKKTKFTLRIPVNREAHTFRFSESTRNKDKISVETKLEEVMQKFLSSGGTDNKGISCRIKQPNVAKFPKLEPRPDDSVSAKTVAMLIANDKGFLMRQALQRKIQPKALRTMIYRHRNMWKKVNVDKKTVDQFLEDYNRAFKRTL